MVKNDNSLTIHDLNLITEKEYIDTIKNLEKQLRILIHYRDKANSREDKMYKNITYEYILNNINMYSKAIRLVKIAAYFGCYNKKNYIMPTNNDYELVMNYPDYISLVDSERIKRLYFLVKDHFINSFGEDYLQKEQLKLQKVEENALDPRLRDKQKTK